MKFSKPVFYCSLIIMSILIINSCTKKASDTPAPVKSSQKQITGFTVTVNGSAIGGSINGTAISLAVPFGTDVTSLAPAITISDKASVSPPSGSAQNFGNPVAYTVTAEDGTKQMYTVTVTVGKSSAKNITAFSFQGLNPVVNAVINNTTFTVTATISATTDITSLTPTITLPSKATISPASGVVQNFTNSINYTVKAEDGSTQIYKVTVTVALAVTQAIDCKNVPAVLEDRGTGVDYTVGCPIVIPAYKVLTIKPGVTVQFTNSTAGIFIPDVSTVGSADGALNMIGTAANPITLEGATATQGAWAGIAIASGNASNQWKYVTVRDAGAGQYNSGLYLDNSNDKNMQVSITNCSFINNSGYGIWDYDNKYTYPTSIFSAFQNNTFTGNSKSALKVRVGEAGSLDAASSYINNGQKYIEVTALNILINNITLQNIEVPYLIDNTVSLNQKMTIMPGATLEFAQDAGLYISYLNAAGSIIANGTATSPIKFIGFTQNVKGYWFGIELDNTDTQLSFNYCAIDGAGSIPSGSGCAAALKTALNFGGNCGGFASANYGNGVVTNCTITNSGGYGLSYRSGHVTSSGNTFLGNTTGDINIRP